MAKYRYNPFDKIAENLGLNAKETAALRAGKFDILFAWSSIELGIPLNDVASGDFRGFRGGKFSMSDLMEGLRELEKIFRDKNLMVKIVKNAYDRTVLKIVKRRLLGKSLARGGRGSGFLDEDFESEERTGHRKKQKHNRSKFQPRGDELGKKWKQVYDLLSSSIREYAPGVYGSFDLGKVFDVNMKTINPNAKFLNVYMMVEFGTGQVADPGPRRYKSQKTTPYKVWPGLRQFGGDTSWWFTFPRSILLAKAILKSKNKIDKLRRLRRRSQLKKTHIPDYTHIFDFAFGAAGSRSIHPRHVIFEARGMVTELRLAYKKAYEIIAQELNELIREKVKFWPRNGIQFSMAGKIPFDFSKASRKV